MPAPLLMVGAMLSFQLGAAVATGLFSQVGVPATAFLKNAVGGILLVAIARPNLRRPPAELGWLLAFGVELALMNVAFYEAIQRIPLGVAVTVEFLGPLSVALLHSRRLRDVLWVILAGAGIAIFAGVPTSGGINAAGLLFAVLAGAGWACYIFTAQRVGRSWEGSQGLAAGMLASAVLLAPMGLGRVGSVSAGSGFTIVALGVLRRRSRSPWRWRPCAVSPPGHTGCSRALSRRSRRWSASSLWASSSTPPTPWRRCSW